MSTKRLAITLALLPLLASCVNPMYSAPATVPAPAVHQAGTLGVNLSDVTPTVAKQSGMPTVSGVLVLGPVPGSEAEKAGLLAGDIVLQIAGTRVNSPAELNAVTRRIRPGFTAQLKVWRNRANIDLLVEISDSSYTALLAVPQAPATVASTPNTPTAVPPTTPASNGATNISFCVAQFDARQIQGLSDYPPRGLITNVWQGPALSGTPARLAMPEFQAFTRAQGYDVEMKPMFCQPIGTSEHCQSSGSEDFLLTLRTFSSMVNCTDTLQGAEALRALLLKQAPFLQASTWRPVGR